MPKLITNPGTSSAREYDLRPGANSLGSDPTNDCVLEDISVSGFHARLDVWEGGVTVSDLDSSNGTFIDREPVSEATLKPGETLRLGGVEMLLANEASDSSGTAEEPVQSAQSIPAAPVVRIRLPRPIPTHTESVRTEAVASDVAEKAFAGTPIKEPPLPPPVPTAAMISAPKAAGQFCKYHPMTPAAWLCPQCGRSYCDLCVNSRRIGEVMRFICRRCAAICSPLEQIQEEEGEPAGFVAQIGGAFAYPFQNGGIFTLLCGTLIFAFLGLLQMAPAIGLVVTAIVVGYTFLYMQNIMTLTARGDPRKPDLPDMSGVMEPFFQMIGTVLLSFGPAIVMFVAYRARGGEAARMGLMITLVIGVLYFPMAFLAVAIFDEVVAVNPVVVVPAILKVPLQYILACILLALVFVVRWKAAAYLRDYIPAPIVPGVISNFVGLYFLTVEARILGLLYYTNHERIGWFR